MKIVFIEQLPNEFLHFPSWGESCALFKSLNFVGVFKVGALG